MVLKNSMRTLDSNISTDLYGIAVVGVGIKEPPYSESLLVAHYMVHIMLHLNVFTFENTLV